MAGSNAVWGIDIGQCSLKALRCRPGDKPGRLVADAFDFIAYPRILSQPGAEPGDLVGDAIKQFLSRNTVRGDRVAISVPGQNGLARFIKLPPVESKKIPDIVRYEARQQIPFDLADVIWDYQRMGGGAVEEGFALETEVGLFAMKRDQVYRALEPFTKAGIQVDIIQLTPLALYNFLLFDRMQDMPPIDQYDPDNPPPSTVIVSLGTDATDLVVTNGYRVWQRSIPLGGNHFTKALTKELKLTFAKAEHLKCNASSAPDPRALFQAMRPVFNDLLTEIQRSIGYFTSIDRRAKIEKIVAMGNAMKMPGLRRYLSQSLSLEVIRVESFERLDGPEILGAPAFKENLLSFGVAYGLAVEALGVGRGTLMTNLLPPEIIKDRFIRSKKPWALAGAAILLLGCAIGYGSHSLALGTVDEDRFRDAEQRMQAVVTQSRTLQSDEDTAKTDFNTAHEKAQHLVGNVDNRIQWLELLKAVNEALPAGDPPDKRPKDVQQWEWKELHIESMECQYMENLTDWFAGVKDAYRKPDEAEIPGAAGAADATAAVAPGAVTPTAPADSAAAVSTAPAGDPMAPAGTDGTGTPVGPSGPGWVIRLKGYRFHNPEAAVQGAVAGAQYVRDTLIWKLENSDIFLPGVKKETLADDGAEPKPELVSMKALGIGYPTLTYRGKISPVLIPDPSADDTNTAGAGLNGGGGALGGGMLGAGRGLGGPSEAKTIQVKRFDFIVEFCWTPTPPTRRLEKLKEAQAQPADSTGQADQNPM